MKILQYSDLHLYTKKQVDEFITHLPPLGSYDIIVIVGDLGNGDVLLVEYLINNLPKEVYFVLGNHDYYYNKVSSVVDHYLAKGFNLLDGSNEYVITHEGIEYTLIGGTGWSVFNLYNDRSKVFYKKIARLGVADFKLIVYQDKKITPSDYIRLHNQEWEHYSKYKNKPNVVLITHFPMSKVCIDPFYEQLEFRNLNPYFINDKNTKGFKLILSGHVHTCSEKKDVHGCTHIINAYGYPSEFFREESYRGLVGSNGFVSHSIIDLKDYL